MNIVSGTFGNAFGTAHSAKPNRPALNWMGFEQGEIGPELSGGLHIQNDNTAVPDAKAVNENCGIMCFAAGTRISCKGGEIPIEHLKAGDLVLTIDHGYRPVRWIGTNRMPVTAKFTPVCFQKGVLTNVRDLLVSPEHRILLTGWQAELLFGESEVLVAAKHLVNDSTVTHVEGGHVTYFHLLFDTHEIVFAEGCPSESLHLQPQNWDRLAQNSRLEILALFPELADDDFKAFGSSARMTLTSRDAMVLCMQRTETSDLRLAG